MAHSLPFNAPDISGPISDRITRVDNAIVIPPAKGLGNQAVQKSGVLTADGEHVEYSVTWRGPNPVTIRPEMPEGEIETLPGRWMFLGPLFGHFGHFLVESVCRIWATPFLEGKIDGVLFVPKFQNRPQHVAGVYAPFLEALGVSLPMKNLEDPTRVEELYVPCQGFGMFDMIEGAPEYRDFVRDHAGKNIAPEGPEKIYVSRTQLPLQRGSIVCEPILETYLEEEGYTIFHPQKHDHATQIAQYRAARQVIGVDASPLHLLGFVGNQGQNVGIIARRKGDLDEYFSRQIRAFHGASAHPISHLKRNWIEMQANRPSRTSWGEVDFPAVQQDLLAAGLITGTTPWPALTQADVDADLARISEAVGCEFRAFENT